MSPTDEIKARLDIVNYISQYVPLKKAGRTYKACCPFHNESTPSFNVDPDRGSWRCFGACGEGGDIFSFAQKYHGWDFRQALEELGKLAGVEVRKQSPQQREQDAHRDHLRGLMKAAAELFHAHLTEPQSEQARLAAAYARQKRGFTDETITAFQIGFAPHGWSNTLDALTAIGYDVADLIAVGLVIKNDQGRVYDRFRHRLMIPIRDERGRVVGFGARALNPEDNPKYLNSPQTPLFDKSRILFGLDTARRAIRESETAVIVEGYMDAIQAQQAGFYNVVAQMGTAMTETQLGLIAPRYAKKIILALDADAAGQNAARRSLEVARQTLQADYAGRMSVDMRVLQMPDAKDPDDLIREAPEMWQAHLDAALPVADFVIQMEAAGLSDDAGIHQREAIARRLLPILIASESDIYTHENIQKLALRLRIPEKKLLAWAGQQREQMLRSAPPAAPDHAAPPDGDMVEVSDDDFYSDVEAYRQMQSGEMPPASSAPPTATDDDDLTPIPRPSAVPLTAQAASGDNVQEGYCLRMLFLHPPVYYQINRRLREIAAGDDDLLETAFIDFGVADFTRHDYRALMQMFLFGLRQAEAELLDFMRETLDPAMRAELERLIDDERVTVSQRVNSRFDADREQLWKQHKRRAMPAFDPEKEAILKALELRRARLKREVDAGRFAMIDAQRQRDEAAAAQISAQFIIIRRALERLDGALADQRRKFA
ncbi:MAG: DNA primase [Anaerolineaceae bacterium]|nr:MAG: DNA primase [Anaerolineaceae bacterium]